MSVEDWDWTRRIFDHVRATTPHYLLDPDASNVEALYRDVGNIGHEG
jgi:hypothetical protein